MSQHPNNNIIKNRKCKYESNPIYLSAKNKKMVLNFKSFTTKLSTKPYLSLHILHLIKTSANNNVFYPLPSNFFGKLYFQERFNNDYFLQLKLSFLKKIYNTRNVVTLLYNKQY